MAILFTNNASSTLALSINASGTSLNVATGQGALFPSPTAGQFFYVTLENAGATLREIVKVTSRSGDVLTIVRAQDNTAARSWATGDKVQLRPTAAVLNNFGQLDTASTWVAGQILPSAVLNTPTITSPAITSPVMTGTILEDVYTITDGAGFAIDPTNGSIQLITLGASRTPTVANFSAGQGVTLMINDGTAFTITWTTIGVVWAGGFAPTLALTGYTVVELWRVGSTYYGALVGNVA